MSEKQTRPDLELLSMTDVIREYHYPRSLLQSDIAKGVLPHFRLTSYSRCYIPRKAVEDRVMALANAREGDAG